MGGSYARDAARSHRDSIERAQAAREKREAEQAEAFQARLGDLTAGEDGRTR